MGNKASININGQEIQDEQSLRQLKLRELKKIAKSLGIKVPAFKSKRDIIGLIVNHYTQNKSKLDDSKISNDINVTTNDNTDKIDTKTEEVAKDIELINEQKVDLATGIFFYFFTICG